jgi:hypothetical protein
MPVAGRRLGMATSVAVAAWHLARFSARWHLSWRWAARRDLVVVDGSFYDVLLRTDSLGLAKQLIRPGSVLAVLAPRADLVVIVDDAAPHPRPAPDSPAWEPWTWGELAPWIGKRVRTVRPDASADEVGALLDASRDDAAAPWRWGRVPFRGARRDLRVTPGPHAGEALELFWGHRPANLAVLAINRSCARHSFLPPVVAPIDDLPELCKVLGLDADAVATARSRVAGRRMLAIAASGRLAAVVKVGPADDAGLRREGEMLELLAAAEPPLLVPRLRWAGRWADRYVVATDAVAGRGTRGTPSAEAVLDLCVAMAQGGAWGESLVHGDLAPWNLVVTDGGLVLVDWENASFEASPMQDLTHFLMVRASATRGTKPAEVAAQLVRPGGLGPRYLARLGIDPARAPIYVRRYFERLDDVYEETGVPARFARAVRDQL